MATYVAAFRGYVADVPRVIFKRCDEKKFVFDELTAATVTPQLNPMEINAGWSLYPVAVLPGQSTFEISITAGRFDADLFAMANAVDYKTNASYEVPMFDHGEPDANHQIVLRQKPVDGSVKIRGLEETSSAEISDTQFKVDAENKTITFGDTFSAKSVEVVYTYVHEAEEAIIDNRSAAIGEASLVWPVYGNGDDCTDASVIGFYIVKVFRARITTAPGMDTSYKSAATYQFTLTALDAKRNDGGAYSTAYFRIGSKE